MGRKIIIITLVSLFFCSGCSTMSKRTKCMWTGAAVGAAIGAGSGAAIGHQGDVDNKGEGSLVGAAAGAVLGGLVGFVICKEEPKAMEAVVAEPPIVQEPEPQVPKPEPVVEPVPEPPKVVEKIILNAIRFDFDRAVIKPEFFPVLDEGINILQQHPGRKVIISGHTCSIGTNEYNMGLSERRAESVKKYLVQKGLDQQRLTVQGYGEEQPVADNTTIEGRKMNRRVEFEVLDER